MPSCNTYCLTWVSLTLGVGYLFTAAPAKHSHCSLLNISKANHSISQQSKSMPQPVTLKKLKLNVLWRPTRPFRTNTQKRCPFHYRGMECKSRKSRNTWSNRQICPWNMQWSRAKTNRVLPWKCTGHSKHPLPQRKRRLYTWTSSDGQHWNQIDYILCSQGWRSSIQSTKTRPGADCGSDHELHIAKFRLKLKKVGKTTTIQVWPKSKPLWLYIGSETQI